MPEKNHPILYLLFVVLSLTLISCGESPRQQPDPAAKNKLSVKDMRADFTILWSVIREMHPGYGRYVTEDSLAKSYDKTYAGIDQPMYEDEFISRLYPFLCALGCGHTQLRHSAGYQPPAPDSHLPFEVLVCDQRAWVTTHKTEKLTTGDEIISINNEPVAAIIQHGKTFYCGDGHVESFKELYLSEYDGFGDVCHMYYHWTAPYHVSVRTNKGSLKNIVLERSDTTSVQAMIPVDKYTNWEKVNNNDDLALYFKKEGGTALLAVRGLEYGDTIAYGGYFDQIKQKGTKNLILDLRHNGGGDLRIVTKLLSYLADSAFGIVKDIRCRLPDPSPNRFAAYFDAQRTESFKGSCQPGQREGGWYHMNIRPEFGEVYGPIPVARSGRFRGHLFVLIDGATFSSAALFSSALKAQRKDLTFIGRETAGTDEGCNGFAMQVLKLPATGVKVEFPWLRVVSMATSPVPGRGIIPDYMVEYGPEDILCGKDMDLVKAIEVIGGGSEN